MIMKFFLLFYDFVNCSQSKTIVIRVIKLNLLTSTYMPLIFMDLFLSHQLSLD